MGRGSSSRKDNDWGMIAASNPELAAMATATKIWPALTTKIKQLRNLHQQHLLPEHKIAGWKESGQHQVPSLCSNQIVMFVPFVKAGLYLSACPFLHRFLYYYGIKLNHLNPNSILHLSVFVHLYETFVGIPPSFTLFRYFFKLKPQPSTAKPSMLGGARIQFWVGRKQEYFEYTLVDSVKDWKTKWFYCDLRERPPTPSGTQ